MCASSQLCRPLLLLLLFVVKCFEMIVMSLRSCCFHFIKVFAVYQVYSSNY